MTWNGIYREWKLVVWMCVEAGAAVIHDVTWFPGTQQGALFLPARVHTASSNAWQSWCWFPHRLNFKKRRRRRRKILHLLAMWCGTSCWRADVVLQSSAAEFFLCWEEKKNIINDHFWKFPQVPYLYRLLYSVEPTAFHILFIRVLLLHSLLFIYCLHYPNPQTPLPHCVYVHVYVRQGGRETERDPPYMVCVAPFPGLYYEWWP